MQTLRISTSTQLLCSEEVYQEYVETSNKLRLYPDDPVLTEPTDEVIWDALDGFLYSRLDQEVQDFLGVYSRKGPIVILDAHGSQEGDEWTYVDRGRSFSVQSWVNRWDGKASTLVLLVCDPRDILKDPPRTRKSILVVGDGIVRYGVMSELLGIQHTFQVIHPQYGEIDSYTVEDAKKNLL